MTRKNSRLSGIDEKFLAWATQAARSRVELKYSKILEVAELGLLQKCKKNSTLQDLTVEMLLSETSEKDSALAEIDKSYINLADLEVWENKSRASASDSMLFRTRRKKKRS